jgi:hypothetical protein
MAYVVKPVRVFDKGIIDEIGDEKIPQSSSSNSRNFLDLGDKIEIVRDQLLLGAENVDAGFVTGLGVVSDVDGNEYIYKSFLTNLARYVPATDSWTNIKTDLTTGKDLSFAPYRTPAGSFLWINGTSDGPLRINAADEDTIINFYASATNYKGYITIQDNRMFLWKNPGNETILYLSYIDDDYPYTAVVAENIGTGAGSQYTFTDTLVNVYAVGRSLSATDGTETFTDNGNGVLTGSAGGTGTINYSTGAISVTFIVAPTLSQAITCSYDYEKPTTASVADFTYSATRVAGQGDFQLQAQGSDEIEAVFPYDGKFYCLHGRSIWLFDSTDDDTQATNKIYREGVGIPNWRAATATGEGIYFIDDSDEDNKAARILTYDNFATKVLPKSKSDSVNLNDFNFDDAACIEFGDFLIWACKEDDAVHNNTLLLYNKKWELWNKADGFFRCFAVLNGKLYGGSSVSNNVYQIFTGYGEVNALWESKDWDLDIEELKKCKKFVVEGEMAEQQELIVETSSDEKDWEELGRIAGDSEYIQTGSETYYGADLYGATGYGSGDSVVARRYMREFKLGSSKFLRTKIRLSTNSAGYLSIKQFIFKDVRLKGHKIPSMFR